MEFELPTVTYADRDLPGDIELGAFSVSLNVADLDASCRFYQGLGFVEVGGGRDDGYIMMKNGHSTIGLFHGMLEGNILTFNPGLTNRMERIEEFLDVRVIAERVTGAGIELTEGIAENAGDEGPAHIALTDPDGNAILIDQFF